MATRARSPFAALRWLREAVHTLWRAPGTLFVAACVILLLTYLPALVVYPIAKALPTYAWTVVLALATSGVAPLIGGMLRVVVSVEQGVPAQMRDLFAPYREGTWPAMVSYSFLIWAIATLIGGAISQSGLNYMFFGAFGFVLILSIWGLGLCQIALARRTVFASLADGVLGTLKNLPGVIVMAVAAYVPWVIAYALYRQSEANGAFYVVAVAATAVEVAFG